MKFTEQNTIGYSQSELNELNIRFEKMKLENPEIADSNLADIVCEQFNSKRN
jgi:hypothetical protein